MGTFVKDCPVLKGIINNIAAKKRIESDNIVEMLDHFHMWVFETVSSETSPNVKVPNFGTFVLSAPKLRRRILSAIKFFRTGHMTYERCTELINRCYPLYKRANFEDLKRGKGITRKGGVKRKALKRLINMETRWKR